MTRFIEIRKDDKILRYKDRCQDLQRIGNMPRFLENGKDDKIRKD